MRCQLLGIQSQKHEVSRARRARPGAPQTDSVLIREGRPLAGDLGQVLKEG